MTADLKIVRLEQPAPNKDVVERLEKLLSEAKDGKIQSFIIVILDAEGVFNVEYSYIPSRMALVGDLEFAKNAIIVNGDQS